MSTITITKGEGFTSISFEKPIEELRNYIYNGNDFFDKVDLSEAKTFWDRGQSLEIYNGRQCFYSCRMTEIKINKRWRKIMLDAWDQESKKYDYENEYHRLIREV